MIKTSYNKGIETEEHDSGLKVTYTVGTLLRMKDSIQNEIDDLANDLDDITSRISKVNVSRSES